jgi:hypothetical protein
LAGCCVSCSWEIWRWIYDAISGCDLLDFIDFFGDGCCFTDFYWVEHVTFLAVKIFEFWLWMSFLTGVSEGLETCKILYFLLFYKFIKVGSFKPLRYFKVWQLWKCFIEGEIIEISHHSVIPDNSYGVSKFRRNSRNSTIIPSPSNSK